MFIKLRILAASTPNFQPKDERRKSYTKTLDTISEETRSLKRSKSESDIFGADDDALDSSGIESFESPNKILHSTFSENAEKCWNSPKIEIQKSLCLMTRFTILEKKNENAMSLIILNFILILR